MTARAVVLGKHSTGAPLRFLLDSTTRQVHFMATATGALTYCGLRGGSGRVVVADVARAQAIHQRTDPEVAGWQLCHECSFANTPQPDPSIWRRLRRRRP